MNTYVTGTTIKILREKQNLTQGALAEQIGVSSKTISKWETAKGLSDISLLQSLAKQHYISFVAFVTSDWFQMVKLYPEGNAGYFAGSEMLKQQIG